MYNSVLVRKGAVELNDEMIRDIRERRQQLSEQIDAARKRGDHEAALDLTSEAWRLWQRLQTAGV